MHEPPHSSIPLLKGLTNQDAKRVIAVGTVLTCSADEALICQGELGNEMFILLSGAIEVRAGDEKGRPIAQFNCGDIFGEVAFLSEVKRSATVVALSDIKVLVVTQSMLRKLMKTMPEIACKVQFNLSLVLCERLAISTGTLSIEHGVAKEEFAGGTPAAA